MSMPQVSGTGFRSFIIKILEKVLRRKSLRIAEISEVGFRRILVLPNFSCLTSVIAVSPITNALEKKYSEVLVTVAVASEFAGLFARRSHRNPVLSIDYPLMWSRLGVKRLFAFLHQMIIGFDLVIVLNAKAHRLLLAFIIALSRPKYVIGPSRNLENKPEDPLFNITTPALSASKSLVEQYAEIVNNIGVLTSGELQVWQPLTTEQLECAIYQLEKSGIEPKEFILGIQVSSPTCKEVWPVERFVEVAKYINANRGARIVLFRPERDAVSQKFFDGLPFQPVDFCNMSLELEAAMLQLCDVVICSTQDFTYLTASQNTPLVWLCSSQYRCSDKPAGARFAALQGVNQNLYSIQEDQVIRCLEDLMVRYPKSGPSSTSIDISEQAVNDYLGFGDIKEDYNL